MKTSVQELYNEMKSLRNDVEVIKHALMPEVKISKKELQKLNKIEKEMINGKEKSFNEIFG